MLIFYSYLYHECLLLRLLNKQEKKKKKKKKKKYIYIYIYIYIYKINDWI